MSAQQMIEAAKIEEALRSLNTVSAPEELCELITPHAASFLVGALKAEAQGTNPAALLNEFYRALKGDLIAEFDCDDETQSDLNAHENRTLRTA